MKSKEMQFFLLISFVVGLTISTQAQDAEALRQRVLEASHSTRINDAEMKPWHLKISFQLYDPKGKPSDQGTIEEWWAGPMLWKLRIESPSYTASSIENREGDFRTIGSSRLPPPIATVLRELLYPMPMTEDLGGEMAHLRHEKVQNASLECIELRDATTVIPSLTFTYTYCFDPMSNVLREIHSTDSRRSTLRDKVENFQGRSVALAITTRIGKSNTATAEVTDLSEIAITEGLFTPSREMERVMDAHTETIIRR